MEKREKEYTVKDIAYMEGVSVRTVYRWCKQGYLQYWRRPGKRGRVFINLKYYTDFKELFSKGSDNGII